MGIRMVSKKCSVEDCDDPGHGWKAPLCSKHRQRLQRHGDVSHTRATPQAELICIVEGCEAKRKARGWCVKHYARFKTHGSPDVVPYHVEKHGMSRHPLYATWQMMRRRCYAPNATRYECYGGRGIEVCDRWRYSFSAFVSDVGERPAGTTLDRIDSAGNYEPGNVRWSAPSTQQKNQHTRIDNKSGHKGVCWDSRRSKWRAYKDDGRKRTELGSFVNLSDAITARHEATVHDADVVCCAGLDELRAA
jgi:hypothetical protein